MSDLLELVADPVLKVGQTNQNSLQKGFCGRFSRVLVSNPEAKVPSTHFWRNAFEWAKFERKVRNKHRK